MELIFTPWKKFKAIGDKRALSRFLHQVAVASVMAFKQGSAAAGGGRVARGKKPASVAGQYPVSQTGRLIASLGAEVSGTTELEVGTNMFYSVYLRGGTRKMARRKMSDNALEEGLAAVRPTFKGWARWGWGSP